jgi:hypothetical protein
MPAPNADDSLRTSDQAPVVPPASATEVVTLSPAGVSVGGLLALLRQDQRLRWRRGERPRVEDYLARYPALRDADAVLDLAYAEFVLREELAGARGQVGEAAAGAGGAAGGDGAGPFCRST